MSTEKYVKEIVSKLKCTEAKKKEIRSQLLSDLAAREEQGETLEEIMESMGSPQEIAEAFHQNLSDADRKAYRRSRIGLMAGSAVLLLIFLMAGAWWIIPKQADIGDSPSQEEISASTENVISLLDRNDFEALQDISLEKMQPVLTQETIDRARQNIADDWGELCSIGKIYIQGMRQKGKLIIVTQVDAIYENVSVVYTISFDKDLKLGGLYMR